VRPKVTLEQVLNRDVPTLEDLFQQWDDFERKWGHNAQTIAEGAKQFIFAAYRLRDLHILP
jgi:hypothetical protein